MHMLTRGVFANRWWIVFGCVMGLIVNAGVITAFTFSVFLKPITHDLGVNRADVGLAVLVGAIFATIARPTFGKAIDYFGLRASLLPMIVAYAVVTAAMAMLRQPYVLIVLFFVVWAIVGTGQTPIAYSKAITGWFDRERGLALGIAIAGVGLGVAIVPQFASYLVAHFGWRAGFVGLGGAILVLGFLPAVLFVREPPTPRNGSARRRRPPFRARAGERWCLATGGSGQ